MDEITVSVIIIAWNSGRYLPRCLEALEDQTFKGYEVIVVDNGSVDGSTSNLERNWPDLTLRAERLSNNQGFAVANNIGARLACGQWLALLNPDAFPEPNWLENLLEASDVFPDAFFASRQIQADSPDLLDGEGDVYHVSGLAWRQNYNKPVYLTSEVKEIFSPCAAAALYPRQIFLDAGGFDEDYNSYHEDVDLGFRLRLRGLRCYYVPQAVVYHVGSASTGKKSSFSIYYGHRNLVWTYFKNMPTFLFWLFLPLHMLANIFTVIWFTLQGNALSIWRAKRDAFLHIGPVLKKRRKIQSAQKTSISKIYRFMDKNPFSPLKVYLDHRQEK